MADNHSAPTAARVIDARDLACPLPVLKLRKVLAAEAPGTVVELLATDPAAQRDVPAFCAGAGHTLIAAAKEANVLRFVVQRG